MAQAMGLTQTAISRIWRMHGVRPPAGQGATRDERTAPSEARAGHTPDLEGAADSPARARTLVAIQNLLRDARVLRRTCPAELDPLLALAIDAMEGALEKQRQPVRSGYARADTALRTARNLLDQAATAAHNVKRSLADRQAAATAAVAAIRSVAEDLRGRVPAGTAPRRCPACGMPFTLLFTVRGAGGGNVTTRMPCPVQRCGKPVEVLVPRTAERIRLEEATAS
jgi:hypothetical protein